MRFSIITLFPDMFTQVLNLSMLGRAEKKGLLEFELIDIRQFGQGVHQVVDGKPYGGGVGMIFRVDVLAKALKSVKQGKKGQVVMMSASGQKYDQAKAKVYAKIDHLILVAGHYEGVDQRFIDKYVNEEISIGDYVLTGGEIAAMAVIDSVARLVPGVLSKENATTEESFEDSLLEYPQYTRPDDFGGLKVPEILLSGNHQAVSRWRQEQRLAKTESIRPDLVQKRG